MTIFYLDYDGGSDASAGTSFATRWKTITSGPTAARIVPGDTIRIMESPPLTNTGQNGQWTDGPLKATQAIASSTNATPIVVTLSGANYTALSPAVGDTLIVNGHTTNTNANGVWKISAINGSTTVTLVNADGTNSVGNGVGGASGTVRKFTNAVVGLTTAVTQNIAVCGNQGQKSNWTASANVTDTVITSDFKEGGECQQIAVAAGFTTGLAAYATTASLNLSGYQQVSFWIKQTAGTLGSASSISLKLCTDTVGLVPVHTLNVPAIGALNQWSTITVDTGSNLNVAILSVALYVNTDNGAQTFLIDNIIACKAASASDSISLTSLISKNSGDEAWFGIQSINGTRVVLEGVTNSIPAATPQRGYAGVTENVTLYKRETIKTAMAASAGTSVQTTQDTGAAGNLISYLGGWNRTDMSTQTGDTWFDGQNGLGQSISVNNPFNLMDKVNTTRYSYGIQPIGSDITIGSALSCNCTTSPFAVSGVRLIANILSAVCCGGPITPGPGAVVQTILRADSTTSGNGVTLGAGSWTGVIKQANNNTSNGVANGISGTIGSLVANVNNLASGYVPANYSKCGSVTANNNLTSGIAGNAVADWLVFSGSTSGNGSGIVMTTGKGTLLNFTVNEATEVSAPTAYNDSRVYSENHDNTAGYAKEFCDGGLIETQTGIVHGSAPRAWKFSPTSTNRSQYYPLNSPIARVACAANALVTVSAWVQRDNTGLTAQLICKGGQIAGVASDVATQMTASGNTWEQISITFTPTVIGVVEIEIQFWGGSTYNGYYSPDLTITQA